MNSLDSLLILVSAIYSHTNGYNIKIINHNGNAPAYTTPYTKSTESLNKNINSQETNPASINAPAVTNLNFETSSNYIIKHKWILLGAAAGATYIFSLYKIIKANSLLSDHTSWNCWKPELNLEDLFDIPALKLTEQLIKDIQNKHYSEASPLDFVTPLVNFSIQIQKEISQITEYIKLLGFLKSMHLESIFPLNKELLAKERLQKLKYINSLFKNWSQEYKVQKIDRFYRTATKKALLA